MAGVAGLEPTDVRIKNLMPYQLGDTPKNFVTTIFD